MIIERGRNGREQMTNKSYLHSRLGEFYLAIALSFSNQK